MNARRVLVLIVCAIYLGNVIISVLTFTNGFLIRRLSLSDASVVYSPSSTQKLKKFERITVLFVDALRYDFIFSKAQNELFGIPTIERLLKDEPLNSRLYKFIADPPTTTMQRIKGMMTGSLPTFIDAGSNFDSYAIEDDSLIRQSYLNNKSVIILGDDTWLSLFNESLLKAQHTYPSFNIKDLDSNDLNVEEKLRFYFRAENYDWNLLVAHLLGIDHCGHTFGPKSHVLRRKLNDTDNIIKLIVDSLDDNTLLAIFGDHGMTETGDHGGDSKQELESALFFYSKKSLFSNDKSVSKNDVRQINLTPTLAMLMGLPIPFSNLGMTILDLFEDQELDALKTNFLQISKFIKKYQSITNEEFIDDIDEKMNKLSKMINENRPETASQLSNELVEFLQDVQEACRQKWSTFDTPVCLLGICLLAASTINLLCLITDLSGNSPNLNDANVDQFYSAKSKKCLYYVLAYLLVYYVFDWKLFDSLWLVSLFFNACELLDKLIKLLTRITLNQMLEITHLFRVDYFIFLLALVVPFSNSYVIRENKSLRFLLVSFILYDLFLRLKKEKVVTLRPIIRSVAMTVLIGVSQLFYVCREEVFETCTQTIFSIPPSKLATIEDGQTGSLKASLFGLQEFLSRNYYVFILFNFVVLVLVFASILRSLKLKHRVLNFVFWIQLSLLFVYWIVQFKISSDNQLKWLALLLARVYISLFVLALFIIFRLQTGDEESNRSKQRSFYFMLSIAFPISLILGQSLLSVWILVSVLTLYHLHLSEWKQGSNEKACSNIFLLLLQMYFFYATGHETTFTHIKWEAGFHAFEGDNGNPIKRMLMGAFIILDTFASSAIIATSIGRISVQTESSVSLRHKNINLARSLFEYTAFFSIKLLFGTISVYALRRHLMVWKIFAPRFVFDALSICISLGLLLFNFVF